MSEELKKALNFAQGDSSTNRLLAVARWAALKTGHRQSYLPSTMDEAQVFEPHAWVLEAMRQVAAPSQPSSAEPVADLGDLFDGAQKHIAHGADLRRRLDNEEPPMPSVLSDWIQYAMTYMQIAYQRDGAPPVSNAQWFAAWRVAFPAPVAQAADSGEGKS